MKRAFFNLKTTVLLALLLFAIILAQSLLEYRSSRKAVMDLLHNQANALIISVARAGEKGLIAYEYQQDKIGQHLITIADMVDRLDRLGRADKDELQDIASANDLILLSLLDRDGKTVLALSSDTGGISIDSGIVGSVLSGSRTQDYLGFIDLPGKRHAYAIALRRSKGGAILVGVNSSELLLLRRTFGAGSVIDDIGQSPGVEYAGILKNGAVLAASKDFPHDSLDSWYLAGNGSSEGVKTRIRMPITSGAQKSFEAIGPFTVAGEPYGEIVIGLKTDYLDFLTARLKSDIIWRSMLFLIIAVAAIVGVLLRQNYKLLSGQYEEIKSEVQKLEQDKALSAKLVAMGELASGVAHEIRNPLNAIKVIIQRLGREFRPQSDEAEYKELVEIIRKETDRINGSIEQFLKFARPPVLHKTAASLNNCARDVVSLFEPRARAKGCDVITEYGEIPELSLDPDLCRQAILNLLENSLAAVGPDGRIALRTYRDHTRSFLEISDNGHGIPDDEKPRVFDLYYTTKPSGTGVGLPMVLRIVKEHGGRIDLLDSPSGGALFRMEFPIE